MRVSNWAPEKITAEVEKTAMDRLAKAGEIVANKARQTAAFIDKTGELRKSIRVTRFKDDPKLNIRVYAGGRKKGDPFYAPFVEYGHGPKKKAHPFMRPALNSSKSQIKDIVQGGA